MISNYFSEANSEIVTNIKKFKSIYIIFLLISLLGSFSDYVIPRSMENTKLIFELSMFFLTIVNSVFFLQKVKKDSVKGDFWYLLVPFLLNSIYYSIFTLLGIIILFLPAVIFFYAPLIATFTNEKRPFKAAYHLAKKNWKLTFILAYSAIILEVIPMLFKLIPNEYLSATISILFSFFDSYLVILLMLVSVNFFYENFDVNSQEA